MRRVREILRLRHECAATDRTIDREASLAQISVSAGNEKTPLALRCIAGVTKLPEPEIVRQSAVPKFSFVGIVSPNDEAHFEGSNTASGYHRHVTRGPTNGVVDATVKPT